MSELLKEIKYALSNIDEGKAWSIDKVAGAGRGWLIREKNGSMIAALPCEYQGAFDEHFAGIHMRTSTRMIAGEDVHVILIECNEYENREPFARICEDFLNYENAQRIAKDPKDWWKRWKDLMGNTSSRKLPYAVIGELLLLLRLQNEGLIPEWTGPQGGSHDVELPKLSFEVKSTIERVDETVTITSQHQLSKAKGKELKLAFFRFEPGRGKVSINALEKELIADGFEANLLEERLRKLGYPKGRTSREESYDILETYVYSVDKHFPRIVPGSFTGGTFPIGVIKLIYDISLSNLPRIQLYDFIKSL